MSNPIAMEKSPHISPLKELTGRVADSAVFDLVMVWKKENQAIERAARALRLKRRAYGNTIEPFAAIISCTSSRKVDGKARSKWAHALMFAAK